MSCPCGDVTCDCQFCCCAEDHCSCSPCSLARKNYCRICRLPCNTEGNNVCQCFLEGVGRDLSEVKDPDTALEVESPVAKDKLTLVDSEESEKFEGSILSQEVDASKSLSTEDDSRKTDFPVGVQMSSDTSPVDLSIEPKRQIEISSQSPQLDSNRAHSSGELVSDGVQNRESKIEDSSLMATSAATSEIAAGTHAQQTVYEESPSTSEDHSTSDSTQTSDPKDAQTQTFRQRLMNSSVNYSEPLTIHIPNYTVQLAHDPNRVTAYRPRHEYNAAGAGTSLLTIPTYQTRLLQYPSNPNPFFGNPGFIPPIPLMINPYFSQLPIFVFAPSGFFDYSGLPRTTFPQPYFDATRSLTAGVPSTSFHAPDGRQFSTTRRTDNPDRVRVSLFRPDQERASFSQSSSDATEESTRNASAGKFKYGFAGNKKPPTGSRYRQRVHPKKEFSCRAQIDNGNINRSFFSERFAPSNTSDNAPPAERFSARRDESASNNYPPFQRLPQVNINPIESHFINLETMEQEPTDEGTEQDYEGGLLMKWVPEKEKEDEEKE